MLLLQDVIESRVSGTFDWPIREVKVSAFCQRALAAVMTVFQSLGH